MASRIARLSELSGLVFLAVTLVLSQEIRRVQLPKIPYPANSSRLGSDLATPGVRFYNVASNLELLAGRGQRAVFEAVRITQDSRLLIQRVTDMERVARQYLVVEDRKLLDRYSKLHDEVQTAAKTLSARALDLDQRAKLT